MDPIDSLADPGVENQRDATEQVNNRQALGSAWEPLGLTLLAAFSVAFVIAIRSSNRSFHGALAIAWLVACLGWGIGALGEPIFAS